MDKMTDCLEYRIGAQVARLFGFSADRFGHVAAYEAGETPVHPYADGFVPAEAVPAELAEAGA